MRKKNKKIGREAILILEKLEKEFLEKVLSCVIRKADFAGRKIIKKEDFININI